MKKLLTLFTLIFSLVAYGAVPLGTVPYAQLDTNDFGVTVAGHINTRLGVHTPSTPGDTWYLTINGTNINNGGTNFLQSINPTAGFLPVRGANTNFVDSLILQDATGLHVGTNFAGIIDYFGYPALTLGDTGGVNTYLTLYPDGLFLKDHYGNALNLYGQTANIGGLIYGKSIMQLGTMWGKVELADDNPAHTAKFQPTLPMGTSHTTLGSSTNAWEGLYAGSTKMFQFFDVIIDPGVSTNLNFAVDGVTYNIGAGGGSVGGTTINSLDTYLPVRLNAGAFDNSPLYTTGGFIATDGRIVFGPGDTNWIGRSGSSLIYSNNADASNPVQFTIERANGDYGSFGVSQAGGAFIRTAAGKAVQIGPNGDDPLYYFSSAAFYTTGGTLAGQQSLGTGTNNWAELRLGTNTLWGSYTDDGTQLLRNGIPLAGATVTYAAVTNALLATGSASDVLHGDGSWGAGGGGGETNWVMISGNALHANTNASDIFIDGTTSERTFNIQSLDSDFVGTVTLDALSNTPTGPGASGIFVEGGDSGGIVDSISIMSDPGLIWDQGTGIYFNETPILLLDNTGSVNLTNVSNGTFTGALTVNDGSGGTNTTGTGWEAGFLTATNYIKALNATASRVAYIAADNTITNATSTEIGTALGSSLTTGKLFEGFANIDPAKVLRTNLFLLNLTAGNNDIWTVPAGYRAYDLTLYCATTNGTSTTVYSETKTNSTYYRISANASCTTNGPGSPNPDYIFDNGETLAVNTSLDGISVYAVIRYWLTNDLPVYSAKMFNPNSATTNTLYTVPAGKGAVYVAGNSHFGSGSSRISLMNSTSGSVTNTIFLVPPGDVPRVNNSWQYSSRTVGVVTGVTLPILYDGTSVAVWNWSNNATDQIYWMSVIEFDWSSYP